jgi:hypothetical protein
VLLNGLRSESLNYSRCNSHPVTCFSRLRGQQTTASQETDDKNDIDQSTEKKQTKKQ